MFIQYNSGSRRRLYMVSIHAQQKLAYVKKDDIDRVKKWLYHNNVEHLRGVYENHGKYRQLHYHGLCWYEGRWKPLTVYGDQQNEMEFHIHWKPVSDVKGALKYLSKQVRNEYDQQEIFDVNRALNTYMFSLD